jgi:hypothetical protein
MSYKNLKLYTDLSEEKKAEIDTIVGELIDIQVQINEAKARGDTTGVQAASSEASMKVNEIWRVLRPVEYRTAFPTKDAKRAAFKKNTDPFSNVGKTAGNKKYQDKKAAATNAAALRSGPRGTPNGVFASSVSNIEKDITAIMAMDPKITREKAIGMLSEEQQRAIKASGTPTAAANAAALRSGPRGGPGGPPVPPLVGFCPLVNPLNYCYMNASMQLLFRNEDFRQTFVNLSEATINASDILLDPTYTKGHVIAMLICIKRFITSMNDAVVAAGGGNSGPIKIANVGGPLGNDVYTDIINLITTPAEAAKPPGDRSFVLHQQADADEFIKRMFAILFESNIPEVLALRNLFLVKAGKILSTSFPVNAAANSPPNSIQDVIDPAYTLFPFTKYITFPINRVGFNLHTGEPGKVMTSITTNPTIQIKGQTFRVKSAVVHGGDATGGHYVCYHFNDAGQPVLVISDAHINAVAARDQRAALDLINREATVLQYERVGGAGFAEQARAAANQELALIEGEKDEYRAIQARRANLRVQMKPFNNESARIGKNWGKRCSDIFRNINNIGEQLANTTNANTIRTLQEELNALQEQFEVNGCAEMRMALNTIAAQKKPFGNQNAEESLAINAVLTKIKAGMGPPLGGRRKTHKRRQSKKTRKYRR